MESRAPNPLAVAIAGSRLEVVGGVWRLSVATVLPPLSFALISAISGPGPGDDEDEDEGIGGGGGVGGNIDPDDDEDSHYDDEDDDDDEDPLLCAPSRG